MLFQQERESLDGLNEAGKIAVKDAKLRERHDKAQIMAPRDEAGHDLVLRREIDRCAIEWLIAERKFAVIIRIVECSGRISWAAAMKFM